MTTRKKPGRMNIEIASIVIRFILLAIGVVGIMLITEFRLIGLILSLGFLLVIWVPPYNSTSISGFMTYIKQGEKGIMLRAVLTAFVLIPMGIMFAYNINIVVSEYKENVAYKKQEKLRKEIAIAKANTPIPVITVSDNIHEIGTDTGITIEYTISNANIIYFNREKIDKGSNPSCGEDCFIQYIPLDKLDTIISIKGENKYWQEEKTFTITREQTEEEKEQDRLAELAKIEAEAEAERLKIEQEREQERIAKEAEKQRLAEEKEFRDWQIKAEANDKKTYKKISFKQLDKSSIDYLGEKVYFKGKIMQAWREDGRDRFRLAVTNLGYGARTDIVGILAEKTEFVEDDIIEIWGVVLFDYCYENVMGGKMCIPNISIDYIK